MSCTPKKYRADHDRTIDGPILQMPEAIERLKNDHQYMAKLKKRYIGMTHIDHKIEKHIRKKAKKQILQQASERKKIREMFSK